MIPTRATVRPVARLLLLLTTVLAPWAGKADGAARPDSQLRRGEQVAQLKCSACHVVAENQKYPPLLEDPAPSFQSIANRPQLSASALRRFLATTHWDQKAAPDAMPNPGLSGPDIKAAVSYILSLKGH